MKNCRSFVASATEYFLTSIQDGFVTDLRACENKASLRLTENAEVCIGIDLGTTNSCVGVWKDGRVEIIANDMGKRTTPSIVAFDETERMIGDTAQFQACVNTSNTIFDAKRLIGRKFTDETVQSDMKHWPFKVVSSVSNAPMIEVNYKGKTKQFKAVEISAMILGKMKGIAEKYLGKEVKNAVITVPAFFNNAQRQSTIVAGSIAGLNVLRIINEPTAAALAYGLHKKETNTNVLVFDLGGGTFDVSVVNINNGIFKVLATAGDTHLGGEDFDNRLVEYFSKKFQCKHHKDISNNPRSLCRLREKCQRVKHVLSTSTHASIDIDSLVDGIDFTSMITRVTFEELCMDYFQKCMDICENVVLDSKLSKADIDEIVLVGGSSRIPKIQSMLSEYFPNKVPCESINPDEAVAFGATVQATLLSDSKKSDEMRSIDLRDVTSLSLGIEIRNGVMDSIIARNTPIPALRMKNYTTVRDNQESIRLSIYEGERSMVVDNNLLGNFILNGVPPLPRGKPTVDVTFDINANGILIVTAIERTSGKNKNITIINDEGRLSKDEIQRMIDEAKFYEADDIASKIRVKARNDLEDYCYRLKTYVKKGNITSHRKTFLEAATVGVDHFLANNPTAQESEIKDEHNELKAVARMLFRQPGTILGTPVKV